MSDRYGSVNTRDEEVPSIADQLSESEPFLQKAKRILHLHRHRVLAFWIVIITMTAVLTLTFRFFLKKGASDNEQDVLLKDTCVSDRSWFVALVLSIFFGPFGIDRFYLGYILLGTLKFLTAGLGGIWWTIDAVLIALNVIDDHPFGCHLQ
ncbi:hypothetical protein G6F37_010410 [Rhizopus arrhizus]|nr:hypothetical protein G6F38_010521 [Rhizopus arrhizus]KAG1153377.1 hypothetical protein G6F37_010410 [Rhizopus arrhizus]